MSAQMPDQRLKAWERLFQHALSIIDAAVAAGATQDAWSFGGGTVLMRRHRHRISKDVDSPGRSVARLSDAASQCQSRVTGIELSGAGWLPETVL